MPTSPPVTLMPPFLQRVIHGKLDASTAWTWADAGPRQCAACCLMPVGAPCEASAIRCEQSDVEAAPFAHGGHACSFRPLVFDVDAMALKDDDDVRSQAMALSRGLQPERFAHFKQATFVDIQFSRSRIHRGIELRLATFFGLGARDPSTSLFGTLCWRSWSLIALTRVGVQGAQLQFDQHPVNVRLADDDRWERAAPRFKVARYVQGLTEQFFRSNPKHQRAMLDLCLMSNSVHRS